VIRLIAAIDLKRGLAREGHIPWNLPSDGNHFKELTLTHGASVLMGQKTYDQVGSGYLSKRNSYVVSHQNIEIGGSIKLVNNLEDFLSSFKEDLWVIGGAAIYRHTIKKASELYLTIVEDDFKCDRFFPEYHDFKLGSREGPYKENGLTFYYQQWNRDS